MTNFYQSNKIPISIATLHWLITVALRIDNLFMNYEVVGSFMYLIKVLYLFVLIIGYCFLFSVVRHVRNKDEMYRRGLVFFSVYFLCTLVVLIVIWPGNWIWDDIHNIEQIREYDFKYWQELLTVIYHLVLIQIIPSQGGIILIQNLIISVCVAYDALMIEAILKRPHMQNKIVDVVVSLIPFFTPLILFYQFSGYKAAMCSYLELTMIVMLVSVYRINRRWNIIWGVIFSTIVISVLTWGEGTLLLGPIVVIALMCADKTVVSTRIKAISILLIVCGTLFVNGFSDSIRGDSHMDVMDMIRPATDLIRVADPNKDALQLSDIDNVININVVYAYPEHSGEWIAYEQPLVVRKYTNAELERCKGAVRTLAQKYPYVYMKERWNTFMENAFKHLIVPFFILFIETISLLIDWLRYSSRLDKRRKGFEMAYACVLLAQVVVLFFTQRTGLVVNYMPCYLCAYVILYCRVMKVLSLRQLTRREQEI